jgi:hypothetical protein
MFEDDRRLFALRSRIKKPAGSASDGSISNTAAICRCARRAPDYRFRTRMPPESNSAKLIGRCAEEAMRESSAFDSSVYDLLHNTVREFMHEAKPLPCPVMLLGDPLLAAAQLVPILPVRSSAKAGTATNNSRQQFSNSPSLADQFLGAIMDADAVHSMLGR